MTNENEFKTNDLILNGLITAEDLKTFYNTLNRIQSTAFRREVMNKCEWSYPTWQNKLRNIVRISKLESDVIILIRSTY